MNEDFKNLESPDEIKLLKYPDNIRQRIGMYLSGNDSTDTLLREIIDNATDECQHTADTIVIDRNCNGFVLVADNGRGIPIQPAAEPLNGVTVTQAELSICTLHSGSKFTDNKSATIGQNGVGSAAVNAVSEDYILLSHITPLNYDKSTEDVFKLWESSGPRSKKDLFYVIWYKKGYKYFEGAAKKSDIEKTLFGKKFDKELPTGMSTIVLFKPDPEIFSPEAMKMNIPVQNLQYFLLIQEKFYKKKVNINVEGTIMNASGFNGYDFEIMKRLIPADTSMNEYIDVYISFSGDKALSSKECYGSVNGLTVDSGVHVSYVEDCFAKALKETYGIKHRYITTGLKLVVVALASETVFSSQTKEKLKAFAKVKPSDFDPLIKEFQKVFRKNPEYWQEYVDSLNYLADSMRNLGAAEKADKIMQEAAGRNMYKNKAEMVEGFSDATAGPSERWNCECFICEGLSPCGSLKAARPNTKYLAAIPLRGKLLNVKDSTADKAMDNREIYTIFRVIGLGIDINNVTTGCKTPEEAYEKIKKYSRYGKIIVATDADEDSNKESHYIEIYRSKLCCCGEPLRATNTEV